MTSSIQVKKPKALRVIFILNALMTVLPFIFYAVFTARDIKIGTLDPLWMVYTGIAYILSFILLVLFLRRRNQTGTRTIFLLNTVIAIPAGAYIGMVIAMMSLGLSFFSKSVLEYFNS